MPTTGQLITTALQNILDIGGDAAEDTVFRERVLLHLRRAVNAVWWYRTWPWTFTASGPIEAANGSDTALVPIDFFSIGPYTRLWKVADQGTIAYRQPIVVRNRLLSYPTATADRPEMWSMLGQGRYEAPGTPVVLPVGTPGISPYSYVVVALFGGDVSAPSAAGSTSTGNAVLTVTEFNRLTWTASTGAIGYDVYRVIGNGGGQSPPRLIAEGTTLLTLDDTGLQGDILTPPTINSSLGLKQIIFAPKANQAISFQLTDYRMKPPVLVDEGFEGTTGVGETLLQVPEQLHENVLLEYIRRRLMADEGDEREPMADQDFKFALRDAWAEEQSQLLGADMLPPGYYGHSSTEE